MMRGLLGHPLGHSYSKLIQEKLVSKKYELYDVSYPELVKILTEKKFDAFNVTIPYKEAVIKYLDELTDVAKQIEAVNCIKNKNGRLIGHNSDYDGFLWLLQNNHINLDFKKIAILGSGGASKAVKAAIENYSFQKLYLVSRNKKEGFITYEELIKQDIDCLINTTPIGMYPHLDETIVDIGEFKNLETVIDIIYNPFNTNLVVAAKERGIIGIGGIEMLVAQAKSAVEFFDDIKIDDKRVNEVVKEIKAIKQNIVFIGMPGAGKSTVSKLLAEKYDYTHIEVDELIEEKIKMPIKEYFKRYGEKEFRKVEKEVIKQLQGNTHCIISCGGGVVKDKDNIGYLRKNGLIVMLDRELERICFDDNRPLLKNKNDLWKLHEERDALYRKYSDLIIANNQGIEEVIESIEKEIKL